jgi:hypothetical protein
VRDGYPTEKPVGLLTTLIEQSSSPGELVIDTFSGSGSCGEAALRAGRLYAGADVSEKAIPGGKAMGFYASYRLSLKKTGKIRDTVESFEGGKKVNAKRTVAQQIRATVEKSKLSAPHRDTLLLWNYDIGGIDEEDYLIGLAMERGVITTNGKGSWTIGKKTIRAAADKLPEKLRNDPALLAEVSAAVGRPGQSAPDKKRVIRRRR